MITLHVSSNSAYVIRRIEKMPARMVEGLNKAMTTTVLLVERRAKQNVTGPFLRVRTGRGRASITSRIESTGTRIRGVIGSNVVYMAAHHEGATIPAHDVVPVRRKALRWVSNGRTFFATRVHIPDVTLRERPWLRAAWETEQKGHEDRIAKVLRELL